MAERNLGYVVAETGPCELCGRDPGDHTVDGVCVMVGATAYYRGTKHHAFVDLDDPLPSLRPVAV